MKTSRIIQVLVLGLSLACLLPACSPAAVPTLGAAESELATQVAIKNTVEPFDVASLTEAYYLSVEVSVSQDGIQPLAATVVQGPQIADSALADMRVQVWSQDEVVADYYLADPRLVEVEGEGQMLLEQATTFAPAPLSTDLRRLQIAPVGEMGARPLSEDLVDLRPWMRQGCLTATQVGVCKEILEEIRGLRVILAGRVFQRDLAQEMLVAAVPWKETSRVFAFDTPYLVESSDGTLLVRDARAAAFDLDLAREYFPESGLESGQPVQIYVAQEDDQLAQVAREVAQALSQLKLKPVITPLPLLEIQKATDAAQERGETFLWLTW